MQRSVKAWVLLGRNFKSMLWPLHLVHQHQEHLQAQCCFAVPSSWFHELVKILRRACQTCTRQSWVEAKALLMLQGKGKYDQILTIYWQYFPLVGTHGYDLFQMSLCLFPLFDALAQIPWLSKSPKVFSKPGLILGPKWVPHLASFPGEDPEDPWANQWWQCSKRTSGSFHSFHLWHWQISTCHNLFATYSQFCALEHSWTDLNGQSLISLAVKWDSSRTRRTLVCHVMFSLGITVHPKVCWWRTVGAEKAHEFHGVSPGPNSASVMDLHPASCPPVHDCPRDSLSTANRSETVPIAGSAFTSQCRVLQNIADVSTETLKIIQNPSNQLLGRHRPPESVYTCLYP